MRERSIKNTIDWRLWTLKKKKLLNSDGSHLANQQPRPVVERCSQASVLRAWTLILYCLTTLMECLSLRIFALEEGGSVVEWYFSVLLQKNTPNKKLRRTLSQRGTPLDC